MNSRFGCAWLRIWRVEVLPVKIVCKKKKKNAEIAFFFIRLVQLNRAQTACLRDAKVRRLWVGSTRQRDANGRLMAKAEVRFAPWWPAGCGGVVFVSAWIASEPACRSLSLPEVRAFSANAYLSAACFSGARQDLGLKHLSLFFRAWFI